MSQLDVQEATDSYEYYAESLLWIKTKKGTLEKLVFNEAQAKLDKVIARLQNEGRLVRVIVLKARQEGVSTYCEGYIFRASHLNEYNRSVIIAHEVESGTQIFNMCKLFYDCLPPTYRPMTKHSNRKELVFANPDKKTSYEEPGLRSSVEVYTAGKFNVARGSTIHCLHCSELASWPFPEDTVPALMPTIPKTPNSLIMFESTAKGVGNYFHLEWLRAKEGDSNFFPFFLSWFDLPSQYSFPFREDTQRVDFMTTLNEEENELRAKYNLTPEQLLWRRLEIKDLRGDIELFRQEYPSNDAEAFIVSGSPVFDRKKLRELYLVCPDPLLRAEIVRAPSTKTRDQMRFARHEEGRLRMWQPPKRGAQYVIGVDVGGSGADDDFTCAQVLRRLPYPDVAVQVGEWHGHIDHIEMAHVLKKLGTMYNNAMVSIEVESYGLALQNELYRSYYNLYQWQRFDNIKNRYTDKLGWETNVRSKKQLIAFATHCVYEGSTRINSADLVSELMVFVRDGMSASAESGYDDRVMAWMIALFTLHSTYSVLDEETEIDEGIREKREKLPKGAYVIDPNFEEVFEYGKQDSYGGSWLNY